MRRWNPLVLLSVPLLNSEQMYQAPRSLRVPTLLVTHPGEAHEIKRPSFVLDRMQRYLDRYGRYLGSDPVASDGGAAVSGTGQGADAPVGSGARRSGGDRGAAAP